MFNMTGFTEQIWIANVLFYYSRDRNYRIFITICRIRHLTIKYDKQRRRQQIRFFDFGMGTLIHFCICILNLQNFLYIFQSSGVGVPLHPLATLLANFDKINEKLLVSILSQRRSKRLLRGRVKSSATTAPFGKLLRENCEKVKNLALSNT